MKLYKLLRGTHDGHKEGVRHRYEKGDHVPLSDSQFASFQDKFEEVADAPKAKTVSKTETSTVTTQASVS